MDFPFCFSKKSPGGKFQIPRRYYLAYNEM